MSHFLIQTSSNQPSSNLKFEKIFRFEGTESVKMALMPYSHGIALYE